MNLGRGSVGLQREYPPDAPTVMYAVGGDEPGAREPQQRWLRPVMLGIAAVFLVLYLVGYPRMLDRRQVLHSPRDNMAYVLSQRFAQGEGFRIPMRHYDRLPPDIGRALTPRDAASIEGDAVPKDFVGTLLVYGALFWLGKPLVLVATPLFAILAGLALARLAQELLASQPERAGPDRRAQIAGVFAMLLWLAYPPQFVNASYITTSDAIAAFFIFTGLIGFVRFWRRGGAHDFLLMTTMLSAAVLMRYSNVLLLLPLALALLVTRRLRREHIITGIALGAPFAATLFAFNWLVYGSPLTTGYTIGSRLMAETVNVVGESLFKFRSDVAANYIDFYVLRWPLLLVPPLIGLGCGVVLAVRHREQRSMIVALLAATSAVFGYYIAHPAWGWTVPAVNASVLRYLLPVSAVWLVFLVLTVGRRGGVRGGIAAVALLAVAGASVVTAYVAPSGVEERTPVVLQLESWRNNVIANTEPDALIATSKMDRALFPERQTLTLTYLLRNEEPIDPGTEREWDLHPDGDRFARVATTIVKQGIPFYLLADIPYETVREYRLALRERGYRLALIRDRYPWLYRVLPGRALAAQA